MSKFIRWLDGPEFVIELLGGMSILGLLASISWGIYENGLGAVLAILGILGGCVLAVPVAIIVARGLFSLMDRHNV